MPETQDSDKIQLVLNHAEARAVAGLMILGIVAMKNQEIEHALYVKESDATWAAMSVMIGADSLDLARTLVRSGLVGMGLAIAGIEYRKSAISASAILQDLLKATHPNEEPHLQWADIPRPHRGEPL